MASEGEEGTGIFACRGGPGNGRERERLHKLIPGVYTGILGNFCFLLNPLTPPVSSLCLPFLALWFARVFGSRSAD